MKTLEVTYPYNDLILQRRMKVGEVFETDDERADFLLAHSAGLVKVSDKVREEVVIDPAELPDLTPPLKTSEEFHGKTDTGKSKPELTEEEPAKPQVNAAKKVQPATTKKVLNNKKKNDTKTKQKK